MNGTSSAFRCFFLVLSAGILSSCASKEIVQLQESVQDMDAKMRRMEQQDTLETAQTTGALKDVNETVNQSLRDIRFTQTNLTNLLEQISSRLGKVEKDLASLQDRVSRLDSFSSETANLTQDLRRSGDEKQEQLASVIDNLSKSVNDLKRSSASEYRQAQQSIESLEARLNKRIDAMDENTKAIYKKILKELGAEVPADAKTAAPSTKENNAKESASGKFHVVESGDTLSSIAAKYGVDMKAIQDLNGIDNPSQNRLGQRLRIP
ncbi:MAG: LysM peptidoglycan-binding domain-containing protein [Candidatus Omnitrophota bacterium]